MAIKSKSDLKYYLEKDREALLITKKTIHYVWKSPVWRYLIALRRTEYHLNTSGIFHNILAKYRFLQLLRLGYKLGFSIPPNTFGPGLRINHHGLIVVNPNARIGSWCDIHQGVNIGQNIAGDDVPEIGNNVWIGPGVKIFGKVKIADGIMIGANSVVNKSFLEPNITIAGVPARKIKDTGNPYKRM